MNGPFGTTMGKARIYEMDGKWTLRLQDSGLIMDLDLKYIYPLNSSPSISSLGDLKAVMGTAYISGILILYKFALTLRTI
jgi:hypothetical protein